MVLDVLAAEHTHKNLQGWGCICSWLLSGVDMWDLCDDLHHPAALPWFLFSYFSVSLSESSAVLESICASN